MADLSCPEIEARLPWYLHGGLAAAEQRQVESHLVDCPGCRAAFNATREASALFAAHPPAEALVDYAFGLPVASFARETLERHLGECEECRDELRLVAAERPEESGDLVGSAGAETSAEVPPRSGRRRTGIPTQRWRRSFALAATLAVASGLSVWLAMRDAAPRPEGGVALVELQPEGTSTRGAGAAAATIPSARGTTLLLTTDRAEPFQEVRVRLRGASGAAPLWEQGGLTPAFEGAYAVWIPAGALPAGEAELELEGRKGEDWTRLGRYRISVAP